MNAISTQLRDLINTGLTQSMMAVDGIDRCRYIDIIDVIDVDVM